MVVEPPRMEMGYRGLKAHPLDLAAEVVFVVSGEASFEVALAAGVSEEGLDAAGFGEGNWISVEDRQETSQEVVDSHGTDFEQ